MIQEEKSFLTERTNTDKSLNDEREKTNRSIIQAKDATEKATNASVQLNRDDADEATLAARKLADSQSKSRGSTVESKSEKTSDKRLDEERDRSDAAVEQERAHVDIAIVQERENKSVIETKLLHQERVKTDENLATERTSTDSVLLKTSLQLSTEVKEHSETKISLTTRDEFLAIVSHDLRNPIGAVSSCMQILLEESVERNFSEDTKTWLELAKRNADSSLRLIRDILDMERMAEGKLELNVACNDIKSIVSEATETFFHLATSKNVAIHSDQVIAGKIPCDRDRVIQILSNLIGNALKFTPKNGKITLKTDWTNTLLTVSVKDTGPGIPKEKTKNIFDKFAQLKSKDRTGLGLGLYISKMLVEAHNGTLWVESEESRGSTFSFQLPIIHIV